MPPPSTPSGPSQLRVHTLSLGRTHGWLEFGTWRVRCALGRSGCKARKREGDGATPLGRWRLIQVFHRPDRMPRPKCGLPMQPLRPRDGWCDAPADRNYNRRVPYPYAASAEALWRADELYDLLVVIDHNQRPRVRGAGSAIFMHVARPGYRPTEGCIALAAPDLRHLLQRIPRRGAEVVVSAPTRPKSRRRPSRG